MDVTLRTTSCDSEHKANNIWDDDLLCKAYYNSIKVLTPRIKSNNGLNSNLNSFVGQSNKSHTYNFDIGDYARATYIDGIDYEARIISINRETGKCVVKYIGFDNEQKVDLSSLITSWGKKARRSQFTRAKRCLRSTYTSNTFQENGHIFDMNFESYPPAPALPPVMAEGSEHLSAMLMAWYMSGYYTGIYEGRNKCNRISTEECL